MDQVRQDQLESLVDAVGLVAVVEALAEIASLKADHLRTNWQDHESAAAWERASRALGSAAVKMPS